MALFQATEGIVGKDFLAKDGGEFLMEVLKAYLQDVLPDVSNFLVKFHVNRSFVPM
jgi:hypothetical protein